MARVSTGPTAFLRRSYAALPGPLKRTTSRAYGRIPFPWNQGWTFARFYRRFSRTQWCSAARLHAVQERELRRVVEHAARSVPAYRRRFAELGISYRDIRCREDLASLPLTRKCELQDDRAGFISDAVAPAKRLLHTTSGSTGTPLTIASTASTHLAERAVMFLGWTWSGYRPSDRVAVCVGEVTGVLRGESHAPYARYRDSLEISPHHLDQRGCDAYLDLLVRFGPRFVRTYPSVGLILGRRMRERGLRLGSVKGFWTQSEVLYDRDRRFIEDTWGAPVFDFYGMQEKCIAMSECEHRRLHLHSEFGLLELVPDEASGMAHIVATGFHNPAMPLLRYQTKDLAVPGGEPCPCGRALPTVERIVGRVEDFLYASDGRQIMEIDSAIADLAHIRECQIVQEALRRVRVRVVPAPGFAQTDAAELIRRVRQHLGDDVDVDVERCANLPRTKTGKQRFIVSLLEPELDP